MGGLCCAADKDRLAVCGLDQWVGHALQFSRLIHRHEGGIERFYLSARESRGKKSALYKVWTFVPTVWFQQRPAGTFCRIVSSVASSDCRELVAISPAHLQLAARYLPLDSVLRATEVVICIWDCLIRSLY